MAKKKSAYARCLKAYRTAKGLSQEAAAEKAGVKKRTWISWENDQATPGHLTIRAVRQNLPDFPTP
jgi:transcriptional regulator with XRE-family HTH domain